MRALIAEDDYISRRIVKEILSAYGTCDVAADGEEAVQAFSQALAEENPYDLVCMDIMMPRLDGQGALKKIRATEREHGVAAAQEVKVIMTTALDDPKNIVEAYYRGGATAFLVKPITRQKLLQEVHGLGLIG